jgi:hypothetical protein
MFKVKLDDVLNKKHLPPLGIDFHAFHLLANSLTFCSGLKDFEEWLLFVEGCPENLFVLPHFPLSIVYSSLSQVTFSSG